MNFIFQLSLIPLVLSGVFTSDCNTKWGSGCIPFVIDPSTEYRREQILTAVDRINEYTNSGYADFYNRTLPENYVLIRDGNSCSSSIGKQSSAQAVNIKGCGTNGIVHELMHAVGVFHEQAREDRDQYVTVNWENVQTNREWNFKIRTPSETPPSPYSDYDYGSLMHYPEYAYSKNGGKTIDARGNQVGQYLGMTELDKKTVDYALLECGETVPRESTCSSKCLPSCRNYGKCVNEICVCEPTKEFYYHGDSCENFIQCDPVCEGENSVCNESGVCECYISNSVHYIGNECEIAVYCEPECQNGGICSSTGTCECLETFSGESCGYKEPAVGPVGVTVSIFVWFGTIGCIAASIILYISGACKISNLRFNNYENLE